MERCNINDNPDLKIKTYKIFKKAYFQLIQQKNEKITVSNICLKAKRSRFLFYQNFENIEDFVNMIKKELIQDAITATDNSKTPKERVCRMIELFKKYSPLFYFYDKQNKRVFDLSEITTVIDADRKAESHIFATTSMFTNANDYYYAISALNTIMLEWIKRQDLTTEELAELINKIFKLY